MKIFKWYTECWKCNYKNKCDNKHKYNSTCKLKVKSKISGYTKYVKNVSYEQWLKNKG